MQTVRLDEATHS